MPQSALQSPNTVDVTRPIKQSNSDHNKNINNDINQNILKHKNHQKSIPKIPKQVIKPKNHQKAYKPRVQIDPPAQVKPVKPSSSKRYEPDMVIQVSTSVTYSNNDDEKQSKLMKKFKPSQILTADIPPPVAAQHIPDINDQKRIVDNDAQVTDPPDDQIVIQIHDANNAKSPVSLITHYNMGTIAENAELDIPGLDKIDKNAEIQTWKCHLCTFDNLINSNQCAMCLTDQPDALRLNIKQLSMKNIPSNKSNKSYSIPSLPSSFATDNNEKLLASGVDQDQDQDNMTVATDFSFLNADLVGGGGGGNGGGGEDDNATVVSDYSQISYSNYDQYKKYQNNFLNQFKKLHVIASGKYNDNDDDDDKKSYLSSDFDIQSFQTASVDTYNSADESLCMTLYPDDNESVKMGLHYQKQRDQMGSVKMGSPMDQLMQEMDQINEKDDNDVSQVNIPY